MAEVRAQPRTRPPPCFMYGPQYLERGRPAFEGRADRNERKIGYWNRANPTVADEVHRGRINPKWAPSGFIGGIAKVG